MNAKQGKMMVAPVLASVLGLRNGLICCQNCRAAVVTFLRPIAATCVVHGRSINHPDLAMSLRSWSSTSSRGRAVAPKSSKSGVDAVHTSLPFPVNRYPEYTRLLPCPLDNTLPRIEHLVVSEGGPALEYICRALDLPPLFVADLIQFGAVHSALVCPKPPPTATPEQMRIYKKVTDPSILKARSSIKGKTIREAQNTFRITHPDQFLEEGSYLRVSVHPKRFPRCYEVDWKSRVIAVTESYVVLDKPAGISVGGTTDNIEECCVTFTARALGFEEPLRTTHQIDNCSEGCVVLARTKEYCSVFHGKIRDNRVKKLYVALAAAPVPLGLITHYMRPVRRAPRIFSADNVKGWQVCQLEVMECREVPWPDSVVQERYGIENCGWPTTDVAYECKINLLTGRTHQIRAQLAALGAPIVGDSMYMAAAVAEIEKPGMNPFGKFRKSYNNNNGNEKAMAIEEWVAQHGKEPSVAIGLQACQISWDDDHYIYKAGNPWWRATATATATHSQ